MLGEIFDILSDKPEKIDKAVIRFIRGAFSLIIAAWLFKLIIGPYKIIDFDSYKDWIDFILKGQVFICLLFYFISNNFLIVIINGISFLFVTQFAKYFHYKPKNTDLQGILSLFDIIKTDVKSEVPHPGKNIDILYRALKTLDDSESQEEFKSLKDTFIENVWNLYFIFTLLYFFIFENTFDSKYLNIIVIITFLIILLFYCTIHSLIEYLLNNYKQIVSTLSYIKTYNFIITQLNSNNIYPVPFLSVSNSHGLKVFELNNKQYLLVLAIHGKMIRLDDIQKLVDNEKKDGRIFIVIVPKEFIGDTFELSITNHDNLIMIEYSDEEILKTQIKQTIESL